MKLLYFCRQIGPVAQLNRVSDYGSEGSRFESWQGHLKSKSYKLLVTLFFICMTKNATINPKSKGKRITIKRK